MGAYCLKPGDQNQELAFKLFSILGRMEGCNTMDDYEQLTVETIATLVEYISYFESNDKIYDLTKEPSLDPYLYHEKANQFIDLLYEKNVILSFDWGNWGEEAEKYFNSPDLIKNADLITIRKLFTTIVRADRFVSGYYAGKKDDGTIVRLLMRLKLIIEEMGGLGYDEVIQYEVDLAEKTVFPLR